MKKYEYKIVERELLYRYFEREICKLGEKGWELVAISVDKGMGEFNSDDEYYIFKREK